MNLTSNCEFCGKKATNYLFASFVCESNDCIQKAMDRRGGPGGHKLNKRKNREILQKE